MIPFDKEINEENKAYMSALQPEFDFEMLSCTICRKVIVNNNWYSCGGDHLVCSRCYWEHFKDIDKYENWRKGLYEAD